VIRPDYHRPVADGDLRTNPDALRDVGQPRIRRYYDPDVAATYIAAQLGS
jgi:hypothetical protein